MFRFRAWHLALAGIIGQGILALAIGVMDDLWPFFRAAATLSLLPVVMMAWPKTRPAGGVLGFLLGIVWAMIGLQLMGLILVMASVYTVVAETPWGPGPGPSERWDAPDGDDDDER